MAVIVGLVVVASLSVSCTRADPLARAGADLDRAMRAHLLASDGGFASFVTEGTQGDPTEAGIGLERTAESTGMLMVYAIQVRDRDLYRNARSYYERTLRSPTHLAYWKVDAKGAAARNRDGSVSSAPIDELRIVRALDAGARVLGDARSGALLAEQAVALRAAIRGGYLAEDVSWGPHAPTANDSVLTAYLDIGAMRILAARDPIWSPVVVTATGVARTASSARPPRTAFEPATERASCDEGACDTIPAMWLALHLVDAGEVSSARGIALYYEDLLRRTGRLPASVRADGTPAEHENLASYALFARLHARLGDRARARDLLTRHVLPRRATSARLRGLFSFASGDAPGFDNLAIATTIAELRGARAAAD